MKRGALAAALLVVLAAGAVFAGLQLADRRMARQVAVQVPPVALPGDAASLLRGKYLFASRGCVDCHGAGGAGRVFVDNGSDLRIKGPNITTGAGGVVAAYQPFKTGQRPDGTKIQVMQFESLREMNETDVRALHLYLKSLPARPQG